MSTPTCNSPEPCDIWAIGCRKLPDGRIAHLVPMIFNVRLIVATERANGSGCIDDGWCYDKTVAGEAVLALATWDGVGDPPGPWKKHVTSGRRGPGAGPEHPA